MLIFFSGAQGYVLRTEMSIRGGHSDSQRISLWLIDRQFFDTSASSPLRIDFLAPSGATAVIAEFLRLPSLAHVCLFKVRLRGGKLLLPLSPNRLQISPNGLPSYFSFNDSSKPSAECLCTCLSQIPTKPICSICPAQCVGEINATTPMEPKVFPGFVDLLRDEKITKTCLVQIIRCFVFKVVQHATISKCNFALSISRFVYHLIPSYLLQFKFNSKSSFLMDQLLV